MTRDGRKALQQALACAGVVALMVAAVLMVARQPGNDELRLAIAELRSQAAELELLRARSAAGAVTPRFAREHAQQLARAIDASREKLASTKVDPPLASARAAATALASQVAAAAGRPDAALPTASLKALEASLRR